MKAEGKESASMLFYASTFEKLYPLLEYSLKNTLPCNSFENNVASIISIWKYAPVLSSLEHVNLA